MTKSSLDTAQAFREICCQNNLSISDKQLYLIEKYVELLLEHNKRVNLISRKDESNIWTNHILHCTSLLFKKQFHPETRILDLGTGGGLPGIVYSILIPPNRITLLDSTKRKIVVVESIIHALNLSNADAVWGRAEEVGRRVEFSQKFDYVVARAVASLKNLIKWSKPFLKLPEGKFYKDVSLLPKSSLVAFKGGNIDDEIRNIRKVKNIKIHDVIDLQFERDEILENKDRKVVVVRFI